MNLPFVSIIINNYNYGRFLESAIDSALRQTYPHVEIIVVDDGSIDDSRKIIASYANKVLPVLKPNGGQASAFNAGFAASRGEIICFLDADDLMLPQRIETVVHILTTQPDLMWGYHQVRQIDAAGNPIGDAPRPNETEQVFRFDVRDEIEQGFLRQLPLPLPGTSGFCFRRSHLQKSYPCPKLKALP
ncbi:MAG: glycosyltransferase family 2 protein [Leptolyngbyaceae cyanobacterium CSU_1_3]|nr:glycosyltransferase family 2 protein [Leptolyngbyaceae cyanobacterium CSU_1_3]